MHSKVLKDDVHLEFHDLHVGSSTSGKMGLFNFFSNVNIDRVACSGESRFMQLNRRALISDKTKWLPGLSCSCI